MAFLHPQAVLFRHCDPAGIVFYPRYFEMLNDCVEAFLDTELGIPVDILVRRLLEEQGEGDRGGIRKHGKILG